jgi:hypothetical protein
VFIPDLLALLVSLGVVELSAAETSTVAAFHFHFLFAHIVLSSILPHHHRGLAERDAARLRALDESLGTPCATTVRWDVVRAF